MLYHNELNLISQLAALDLPIDPQKLPFYCIGEMVNDHMKEIYSLNGDGAMSSKEWLNSLTLIKNNPKITALKVLGYTNQPENGLVCYCFSDDQPNSAILAFRGTTGIGWVDNIKGGFISDTPQQLKALEFFHTIDSTYNYPHYILTGHSKGGNNSQYITIVNSTKISLCITFNSQGFSTEFIQKYAFQIRKNKEKIIAYESAWDVVNILLNSIAGNRMIISNDSKLPHQNHPPNRFLDQSGDIRCRDKRHPFYVGFQSFTMNLSKLSSILQQQLKNKDKNKDKDSLK